MSFVSITFLIFLPVVVGFYYLTPSRYRWAWLCSASLFFYGYWDLFYIPLILISALIDYRCGFLIWRSQTVLHRRLWLLLSLTGNLGILLYFKYWNFFANNIHAATGVGFELHDWLLPIGLSFYTLQTLSYSFDIYRGKFTPERHFGIYFLYVSFFPQLFAGPIERAGRLLPQLKSLNLPTLQQVRTGALLIAWGFFLKLFIANNMSHFINAAYESELSGLLLWGVSALVMLKVYVDFLAYTEIARGCALLVGVSLSYNFRQPFFAKNLNGFWQRWHITLAKWLIDYVQVPLLKRFRNEPWRSLVGVFTLCLIVFWHGASWNFLLFGLLHGIAIALWGPISRVSNTIKFPEIVSVGFSRIALYVILILSAPLFYITLNSTCKCNSARVG